MSNTTTSTFKKKRASGPTIQTNHTQFFNLEYFV